MYIKNKAGLSNYILLDSKSTVDKFSYCKVKSICDTKKLLTMH